MVLGVVITLISLLIVFNFDPWFDRVVTYTTERSQPLLGFFFCIFVAWIWQRNGILEEIRQGSPEAENGWFFRIWPFYVRFICPLQFSSSIFRNIYNAYFSSKYSRRQFRQVFAPVCKPLLAVRKLSDSIDLPCIVTLDTPPAVPQNGQFPLQYCSNVSMREAHPQPIQAPGQASISAAGY